MSNLPINVFLKLNIAIIIIFLFYFKSAMESWNFDGSERY